MKEVEKNNPMSISSLLMNIVCLALMGGMALWVLRTGSSVSEIGSQVSGLKSEVSGLELQVSDLKSQVSVLASQVDSQAAYLDKEINHFKNFLIGLR